MSTTRRHDLVLAVYPNTRGFAFVLFEGSLAPVDWGIVKVSSEEKNRDSIRRIAQLLGRFTPEALVLQDMSENGARRARRIRDLNEAIGLLAETQGVPVFRYSRGKEREHFASFGMSGKRGIAEAIAKQIPMLARFLPPVRKIWMSEDARMGLFDATALALTFFYRDTLGETQAA
jgi:hypothetical protein